MRMPMGLAVALLSLATIQAQNSERGGNAVSPRGVYVISYRTPAHVRSSSPEVFHRAAADVRKALMDMKVVLLEDRERGFIESESQMSVESMTRIARQNGAGSLLFVTVDRPTTKWIKLILQSYDLDGKLLWEETVDSGMSGMSGASGYSRCFERLKKKLPSRVGGPGLPVSNQ